MSVVFPFKKEKSPIFGTIHRPLAQVFFKSKKDAVWQPVTMIVDSGADYTLLPRFLAAPLGIELKRDCREIETQGVGGKSLVYLLKTKLATRIGQYQRQIPVGFVATDHLPPLLGRHEFLETFKVIFENFKVQFE